MKIMQIATSMGLGLGMLLMTSAASAQWVTLTTTTSDPIQSNINPKTLVSPKPTNCTNTGKPPTTTNVYTQSSSLATGKFSGLPGSSALPGYILVASQSPAIVTNSTTVGTLYDRVYCLGTGSTCNSSNTYIFATRVNLNTSAWDPTGLSYEVNDYFHNVLSTLSADVGYFMGTVSGGTSADTAQAFKYLELAGHTTQGLGQTVTRANGTVEFRADANANDPDACLPYQSSSAWSPWLYVKQTCAGGVGIGSNGMTSFALKVREGGEESQTVNSVSFSTYVCKAS